MLLPVFLACFVFLVWADEEVKEDISVPGKCPQLSSAENFDVSRYGSSSGLWYYAYYYCRGRHLQQIHCPEVRMRYEPVGIKFISEEYYLNQSQPFWLDSIQQEIPERPGFFRYIQPEPDQAPRWYYQAESQVLLTDYDNYAVWWACLNIEGSDRHNELAIISSRQRNLAPQYFDQIKAYFAEHYPSAQFQAFRWNDCRARCPQSSQQQ